MYLLVSLINLLNLLSLIYEIIDNIKITIGIKVTLHVYRSLNTDSPEERRERSVSEIQPALWERVEKGVEKGVTACRCRIHERKQSQIDFRFVIFNFLE